MHALVDAPGGLLEGCHFDEDALLRRFLDGDRSYRSLLATLLDDFAERHGKRRWSEKTPQQTPAQAWHLLPEAQIVHIHRDPRAVIASMVTTWSDQRPPWLIAQRWSAFTRTVLAEGQTRPESFRTIRYEDLATYPEATLQSVCEFLGEDFTPDMLAPTAERLTAVAASTSRWQAEAGSQVHLPSSRWTGLPLPRRAQAARVLRNALEALGYPPAPRALAALGNLLAPAQLAHQRADRRRQRRQAADLTTPEAKYAAVSALSDAELRVRLNTP